MARPIKKGLDYFPFDVDFFEDEKLEAISGEFGSKGELATIRLLCAVYKNGYFAVWSELLKMKLVKQLREVSPDLLEQIVNRLVNWGFFDKSLFDSAKVLTSIGIQKRYFEAKKRQSKEDDFLHLLVNVCNNRVNVYNNPLSSDINTELSTQRKEKESILNESKESIYIERERHFLNLVEEIKLNETAWIETLCMNNSLTSEAIDFKFIEFVKTLVEQDYGEYTRPEFKKHFSNWIRKNKGSGGADRGGEGKKAIVRSQQEVDYNKKEYQGNQF